MIFYFILFYFCTLQPLAANSDKLTLHITWQWCSSISTASWRLPV